MGVIANFDESAQFCQLVACLIPQNRTAVDIVADVVNNVDNVFDIVEHVF